MGSTSALLLQLLLISLASALKHYGGLSTFYGRRNSDGTFTVNISSRATFDGCQHSQNMRCYKGNCGYEVDRHTVVLDNSPKSSRQWCEAHTLITRSLPSNKPFDLRESSCCWISTRNHIKSRSTLTTVDLGQRSDTREPNRSPATGVLPFVRVPQNCPRSYKLMAFDADGDRVRCRYGKAVNRECSSCSHPAGFYLDQDSCTLHYSYASSDPSVFGFELVVEDFPQQPITLAYSDGSHASRSPLKARRKRQAVNPYVWDWHTSPPATRWQWILTRPRPWSHWPTTTQDPRWQSQAATKKRAPPPGLTTTTAPSTWWRWWKSTTEDPWSRWPTTTQDPRWQSQAAPTRAASPTGSLITPAPLTWPWWRHTTGHPGWQRQTTTRGVVPPTGFHTPSTPPPWARWKSPTAPPWWWWTRETTGRGTTPYAITGQKQTLTPRPWWWWWWTTQSTESTTIPWWVDLTTRRVRPTTRHPNSPTPSLSKLPLQFSLLVDPPVPSCQEGHYIPRLVYPTPQNGQRIYAEVNKEVEIRVKAQAMYAKLHDIIVSGPPNSNKHRTTHNEFVLRWIPRPGDEGRHYPLCFAVESVTSRPTTATTEPSRQSITRDDSTGFPGSNLSVFQSEMTCVLLDVQKSTVKATVTCSESSMTVAVERASLHWIHLDHLRLSDVGNIECGLQRHSNSTHVIAVIPLNSCGTQLEEDDDNLVFKNEIITVDDGQSVITRTHRLQVGFRCQYPKRGNVTQSFIGHRKTLTVWEKGFGMFTYQFEFYPNEQFQSMISPTLYPLDYKLGSRIYMKIEASSSVNNTELFVESCRAAPYDNPNFRPTYSIMENGCAVDATVQIHAPAHEHEFRFSMEAFQFIGLHDHVYISCSVLMCEAGNPHTRCSRGCIKTIWTDGDHRHGKREAVIQSANHFVSQGPLRLKRSEASRGRTGMNLNLNLIFMAGCLLAVVGMISAVVMYKAKMSSVKYERLQTFES